MRRTRRQGALATEQEHDRRRALRGSLRRGRSLAGAMVLALALLPGAGAASEFKSLAAATALYDAPSQRARKLYAASSGLPVEVIVYDGPWVKVRDSTGELIWVERSALADARTVIVTAPTADVRERPDDGAPIAFQAQQGVILSLVEVGATGWARVRHRDGATGYVRIGQIWGV